MFKTLEPTEYFQILLIRFSGMMLVWGWLWFMLVFWCQKTCSNSPFDSLTLVKRYNRMIWNNAIIVCVCLRVILSNNEGFWELFSILSQPYHWAWLCSFVCALIQHISVICVTLWGPVALGGESTPWSDCQEKHALMLIFLFTHQLRLQMWA